MRGVSGGQDDPGDRGGRHGGDVMAGVDLNDLSPSSVRHEQLGLRRDRVVLASDDLPLRQSGRGGDRFLVGQCRGGEWLLCGRRQRASPIGEASAFTLCDSAAA
jgi:hypothetical protein